MFLLAQEIFFEHEYSLALVKNARFSSVIFMYRRDFLNTENYWDFILIGFSRTLYGISFPAVSDYDYLKSPLERKKGILLFGASVFYMPLYLNTEVYENILGEGNPNYVFGHYFILKPFALLVLNSGVGGRVAFINEFSYYPAFDSGGFWNSINYRLRPGFLLGKGFGSSKKFWLELYTEAYFNVLSASEIDLNFHKLILSVGPKIFITEKMRFSSRLGFELFGTGRVVPWLSASFTILCLEGK